MAQLKRSELIKKLKKIKLLIMDVDGVLTDDMLYIGPDGFEMKRFYVGDGLATWYARKIGLDLAIISSRKSVATDTRAKELRIRHTYQENDKVTCFEDLKAKTGLKKGEFAFIGNDLLDIPLAKIVGVAICTADAILELKKRCHYITKKNGGEGAVREVIELIMKSRGVKQEDLLK
jgi:3-deoxy-D-manno-octulosonate 8-phosphate phosphatase (KDO 8-P phosphatase)